MISSLRFPRVMPRPVRIEYAVAFYRLLKTDAKLAGVEQEIMSRINSFSDPFY
jgi:hypothetical protein